MNINNSYRNQSLNFFSTKWHELRNLKSNELIFRYVHFHLFNPDIHGPDTVFINFL